MWLFLRQWFANDHFMPHGACLIWQHDLVWLHAGADALITLSYYSIPVGLIYYAHQRRDLAYRWMFVLFAVFIFACGTTHLMDIWTLWHPDYAFQGLVKLFTALVSSTTAVLLWPLIPRALDIPSPTALRDANHRLLAEIDEHRRTHALLVESEARFRTLAEAAPVMIWMTDPESRQTYCNQRLLAFSGQTSADPHDIHPRQRVHPDDQAMVSALYADALATRTPFHAEYRAATARGEEAWIWETAEPRHSYRGEFLGYIGSLVDITERKSAELGLKRAKQFLESIVENIPDTVVVKDANTRRYVSVNQAGLSLWGYTLEEVVDRLDAEIFPPLLAERIATHDTESLSGERVYELAEESLQHRNGQPLLAQTKRLVIRNDRGNALYLLWIIEDRTEAKELEHLLLARRAELVCAQRRLAVNELGTSLAHELSQPIGAIANYTEGAMTNFAGLIREQPELGRFLTKINQLSTRVGDIFRNLRALVGKARLDVQPVQLNDLIIDTLQLIAGETARRQVRVQLQLAEDLPRVVGNWVTLQQLLLNLIMNGLEAMDGVPISERVLSVHTARISAASVQVSIADRGQGMPQAVLARLYEPFITTKTGGLGLGLPVCRTILEAHNGQLAYRDRVPAGTLAEIILPCEPCRS